jgi:hypothetical protein
MILTDKIICNRGESRADFAEKVRDISARLLINPNWLMVVMYNESGLNAQAVNKQKGDPADPFTRAKSRATGLIQFMPRTAQALGTTTQALFSMSNVRQLDYVYQYYRPWAGRIKSYFDLYMITFFPAAVGKPDDYVLQTSGISASVIAAQNPGFDINKDNKVTVGEAKRSMLKAIPAAFIDEVLSQAEKKSLS